MKTHNVSIIPQESYNKEIIAAKIGAWFDKNNFSFQNKVIMLKPSFVLPSGNKKLTISTNTHNSIIIGVAKALSLRSAKKILIAEHKTIGPARFSFVSVNIKKWIKNIPNVELCFLDEVKMITKRLENSFIDDYSIKFPKILLDGTVDYLISLPKLKTNIFSRVSLSVKNNFGLINKKDRLKYHGSALEKHLASIHLLRTPNIIITDAIISGEGQGPQSTTPIETHMLICGTNCLAVDAVSCYLMGIDAQEVQHLRLLEERGMGTLDCNQVEIENQKYLESRKRKFKCPSNELKNINNVTIFKGRNICKGGCLAMLRSALDGYTSKKNGNHAINKKIQIIIGKDAEVPDNILKGLKKNETIIFGDCASKYKHFGVFFNGCPPDYLKTSIQLEYSIGLGKSSLSTNIPTKKLLNSYIHHIFSKLFYK